MNSSSRGDNNLFLSKDLIDNSSTLVIYINKDF